MSWFVGETLDINYDAIIFMRKLLGKQNDLAALKSLLFFNDLLSVGVNLV